MSPSPFAFERAGFGTPDPRDTMIQELWKRLDEYRAEERQKLRNDIDQAHAKIRFLRKLYIAIGTAFAGAVGTALIKVLIG